jgi:hypothetical protein
VVLFAPFFGFSLSFSSCFFSFVCGCCTDGGKGCVMKTVRIGNRGWTIVHDATHDLQVVGGIAVVVDERMGGG